jgi:hypothetical protein
MASRSVRARSLNRSHIIGYVFFLFRNEFFKGVGPSLASPSSSTLRNRSIRNSCSSRSRKAGAYSFARRAKTALAQLLLYESRMLLAEHNRSVFISDIFDCDLLAPSHRETSMPINSTCRMSVIGVSRAYLRLRKEIASASSVVQSAVRE